MSLAVACPICDAAPGEPCFDANDDLAFKGQHAGRMEAGMQSTLDRRLSENDVEKAQAEITRINQEIGRLMARRREQEKIIAVAQR